MSTQLLSNISPFVPASSVGSRAMRVHLVNPSLLSFGVGVITSRRLFVLGAATPGAYGPPHIVDETLEPF